MKCDWVFLTKNNRTIKSTIQETRLPELGDGKVFHGIGFEVQAVITNRIYNKNNLIFAVEH